MSDGAVPEADRPGDAQHPRLARRLWGQDAAEAGRVVRLFDGSRGEAAVVGARAA